MNTITHISNANNYTYKKPSFKSKMFEIQMLQNIKGIPCACCGHKVISPNDVAHTFARVSRPLSEMLKKGFLDVWKEVPVIWDTLVNFAQKYPQDSFDVIVQRDDDMFHDIRGKISSDVRETYKESSFPEVNSLAKRAYNNILYSARTELNNSKVVMERFDVYKKYLSGKQLETFETLQIYSQKYPDKRLSEIINMPEVYDYHKANKDLHDKKQLEKLKFRFNNIREIIKSEDPLSLLRFKNLEPRVLHIMARERDIATRTANIKRMYESTIDFMKCNKVAKKVLDEVAQFPDLTMTEDDFFVYAHDNNFTDAMIIRNILDPFIGSFEHIIPKSVSGNDSIYNGIVMCSGCNRSRNTKTYTNFVKIHPEMKKNTQRQINHVIRLILTGKIDDISISRWPIAVSKNIELYTDGIINPEFGNYTKFAIELIQEKYESDEKEIKKLNNQLQDLGDEKAKLQERLDAITKKETEVQKTVTTLERDNNTRGYDLSFLKRIDSGETECTPAHFHEKIELAK